MPAGSFFFDAIIRQDPVNVNNLHPEDNLEEFTLLSAADLKWYEEQAQRLASSTRAVVGGIGGTAFGDIALVPAPFLKHPRGIRDVAEWYISTVARQDYIHAVFARQCEIALQNLEKVHAVLSRTLDVVFVCGTDFGTQASSFCSTDTYEEPYAPYYRKINAWIHGNTAWKTFKHSCGAVEKFIPHFIDSGFDIVNPVQCSAAGMDPRRLKDNYGDRIVFWGAALTLKGPFPSERPAKCAGKCWNGAISSPRPAALFSMPCTMSRPGRPWKILSL